MNIANALTMHMRLELHLEDQQRNIALSIFFRALRRFRDSFKHVVDAFESACVVCVATPTLQHLISSPMLHSVWVHLGLWYSYALSEFWYIRFASN